MLLVLIWFHSHIWLNGLDLDSQYHEPHLPLGSLFLVTKRDLRVLKGLNDVLILNSFKQIV